MKQLFDDVFEIIVRDTVNPADHLCKLYEETGELAQVINKLSGRKKMDVSDTEDNIRWHIMEELADSIQVLFSIAHSCGISYEDLIRIIKIKNEKYKEMLFIQ